MMYQICEVNETENHAGSKAPADITNIASKMGFEKVYIKTITKNQGKLGKFKRQLHYIVDWNRAYERISNGSILLIQPPFHKRQFNREHILRKLKDKKNVKFISLIHDVEELRKLFFNKYYEHEFEFMLSISDTIIVHNKVMKKWFLSKGVDENKIVTLEIFDYLQDMNQWKCKTIRFEKIINIAGNLDTSKSKYIGKLGNLKNIRFNLFGPNFNMDLAQYKNLEYKGSFPVDVIPTMLNEGFGLIWDGDKLNTCSDSTGHYLKFNNPHKLSLYLSSGLPVFIWKDAAEAEFIVDNHIGFAIESICDIEDILKNMKVEEYDILKKNVRDIGFKLINGEYTNKAIKSAIDKVKNSL